MCRAENWWLGIWNCDSGVQFPVEQIAIPGVAETQDPLAVIRAMPQVSQGSGTTVLLFENLTPSPNPEPGLVRESSCPDRGWKGFSDEEATQCRADRGLASAG